MKKKRLSMFSLLIALTLTLGACDDLEDRYPTGSDSDESSEVAGDENPGADEDPSSGVNPNEDENDDGNDNKEGNEPVITYSLSITNKADLLSLVYDEDNPTTTDYTLAVSLLTYTDGELTDTSSLSSSDVSVTSSNENVATVSGLTLTLGSVGGSSEIVAVWNADSSVTDSFTLSYTYTAHVEKIDYEYNLSITNKTELLGTDSVWLIDSGVHTFELALTKTTIVDGVAGDSEEVTGFTATLSQTDLSGSEQELVTIENLSATPAALGSVRITATFTDDGYTASDYIEVMINESYYEGDYSLKINNVTDFTGTDDDEEDVWRVGDAINLDVTLSYKWYAYSTQETVGEEQTLAGTYSNLSVLVYNSSSECVTGEGLGNDIYYYTLDGTTLTLVPQASAAGNTYTIVVYWTGHTEAYETFEVTIGEKLTNSYTLTITTNEIPSPWYFEDQESYTVTYTITEYDVETETTNNVDLSEISTELICYSTSESVATVALNNDGSITITAHSAGTASIYFGWSTHLETITHIDLNIAEHVYTLLVNTPSEGLGTEEIPWRVEEGNRSISLSATMDGADATPTYVEVKSSDESVVTVTGSYNSYTLTPVGEGNTTIVASWYKNSEEDETPLATAEVPVYISDEVLVTGVTLNESSLTLDKGETETLTATLETNGGEATNKNVSWDSSNPSEVSVVPDSSNGLSATVTALEYDGSATISVTTEDGNYSASCTVTVSSEPMTPVNIHTTTWEDTIISNPDENGVYVLGTGNETYYSGSGITTSYSSAEAIRVMSADASTYYLLQDEKYLTTSLGTSESSEEAATFAIDGSGAITLSGSQLGLTESGLSTSSGSPIYLIDIVETDSVTGTTTGGSYYLSTFKDGSTYYWAGGTQTSHSDRLQCSSDINEAASVTLTNCGGNKYTMKTSEGKYIHIKTTGSGDSTSYAAELASSEEYIYYDADNNRWGTEDFSRYLLCNSSDTNGYWLGAYTYNSSYGNANMFAASGESSPSIKGIAIRIDTYDIELGHHANASTVAYPSCISSYDVTWEPGDSTYIEISSGNSVTIEGLVVTGDSGVKVTATSGSVSHTITVYVNAKEVVSDLIGTYDFSLVGSTSDTTQSNNTADKTKEFFGNAYDPGNVTTDPLSSVSDMSYVALGAGGSSGSNYLLQLSHDCIKLGGTSSGNQGKMTLTFDSSVQIQCVEVVASAWQSSEAATLTINNVDNTLISAENAKETEYVSSLTTYVYNITGSNTLSIEYTTKNRCLVFSIALYSGQHVS